MNNGYASGFNRGSRPSDPHAQMAYDAGARHRQMSEDHAKQRNAAYQRDFGPQSHSRRGGTASSTPSKLPHVVAVLGMWGVFMAAWDRVSGVQGSHPDWYVIAALVLPVAITVILRKHVGWLALLAIAALVAVFVWL